MDEQNGNNRPPLRRSRSDRIIAGVCGGLGESTGVDPMIFRIGFVVLTIFTFGTGMVLYAAAWLLIRDEGAPRTEGERIVGEVKTRIDDYRSSDTTAAGSPDSSTGQSDPGAPAAAPPDPDDPSRGGN